MENQDKENLDELLDKMSLQQAQPAIEAFMKAVRDQLEMHAHTADAIRHTKEKEDSIIEASRDFFTQSMTGDQERRRIERGYQLVLEMAPTFAGGKELVADLKRAGAHLLETIQEMQNSKETQAPISETLQEGLGISDQTIETIYQMGCFCFQNNEMHKVQDLFSFLTCLNDFIFEAWLILGIAHKEKKDFFSALQALSMASLMNLHHLAPHLCTVEVYLLSDNKELAKQTLDYCLSLAAPEDLKLYQPVIQGLRSQVA